MNIKRDLSNLKKEVIEMYKRNFDATDFESKQVIGNFLDLSKSYGYFIDNKLVSTVCISEKKVVDNKKSYNIYNICAIMTDVAHRRKGYASKTLAVVLDEIVNECDSIIMQAENWEVYKKFSFIDSTVKYEYQYIPGVYPTPMIMVWNEPLDGVISDIESTFNDEKLGVVYTEKQINAKISIYKDWGLKFLSNPFAYAWYDEKKQQVVDLCYSDVPEMTWLLHSINLPCTVWLFEKSLDKSIKFLKPTGKHITTIKTYKKSKVILHNIKLTDFFV